MPILFRDYETRSTIDLKRVGGYKYATHAATDVWCCAYAVDDGPVQLWTPGMSMPAEFIEAANNPDWLVSAFNDTFERRIEEFIMAPRYGWPTVPIERHRCSQAAALAHALPAKLAGAAAALGTEQQKDAAGHRIMLQMSRPRAPRAGEDPNGIYWFDDDARREKLYAYCKQDVVVERALHQRIRFLSDAEQKVWELDAIINDRGIYLDRELIDAALRIASEAETEIARDIAQSTDGTVTSISQVDKLIAWLAARGLEVTDLRKPTLRKLLARADLPPDIRRALELRLAGAHAAARKLVAMRAWRAADGRARDALKYHVASTGRWGSWGIQVHNLKRPVVADMGAAIAAVSTGSLQAVKQHFTDPMSIVGDIGRAIICAAPGNRLLAADFSGVESRITAWLSGQQSKVDQWAKFDQTNDPANEPYYLLGKRLGQPEETARAVGKTADLAFGYMGSVGAWRVLAPNDTSSDEQIQRFKHSWRDEHPETVKFWRKLERAPARAIQRPGETIACGRVSFTYDSTFLRMHLPSGRDLAYPHPRLHTNERGDCVVIFKDNKQGKFDDCRQGQGAYGGTWIENAVQAVARDLFADALPRLEAAGYPIVLHVHDEIVCEVPIGIGSVEEFHKIMITPPAWADGLPIAAKARNGARFAKIEPPRADGPAPVQQSCANATPEPEILQQDEQTPPWEGAEEMYEQEQPAREYPRSNGFNHYADSSNGYDHYPHGEREWGNQAAAFVYRDAAGQPYLQVRKFEVCVNGERKKQFPQFHLENGRWVKSPPKGPRIPYRLPELLAAPADAVIDIMEGEKDTDRGAELGLVTTTNPGGAGKWGVDLNPYFGGRRVRIHEDNDEAGRAHVAKVADMLRGVARDVTVVRYPELPVRGDFSDFMDAGGTIEAMLARAEPCTAPKLVQTSAEFVTGFVPPDYLIVGWLQRRFIYSLTAATGAGKTAIALLIALLVSQGRALGKLEVKRGRVLYFAGENPDDVRMRWIAAAHAAKLTAEEIDNVYFVPGVFKFTEISERIHQEMEARELALVIVDTSAAYFETDDENNTIQMLAHAKRLRELSRLPGGPTVLICCHPTKSAEVLVPRGGGSFLNEVDGNLTAVRDELIVEVHWEGKFRGPEFPPMDFRLDVVTHDRLQDSDGNPIRTIIAQPLDEIGLKQMREDSREDQNTVLLSIEKEPELTQRERARELGWMMKSGEPYQMRVSRAEVALKRAALIKQHRGQWELTDKGKREIKRILKAG